MRESEQRNKWVVRIFAFLTACALWLYVMNEQNPITERSFTVPLSKTNLAENMVVNNMPESEAAFKLAKEGIISRLRTDRIIKDNILWSYIYAQDMGMDVDKRIKQYNDVQKMTLQDVIGFQKKWMKDRTYTYCILGDKKELDMEALKTIAPIEELTQEEIFGY